MKINKLSFVGAAILATLSIQNAQAQNLGVVVKTTSNDNVTTIAARLHDGPALSDLTEQTDPMWLVIDMDGDGIFNSGIAGGNFTFDGTLAGLQSTMIDADDYVQQSTTGNAVPGRAQKTFIIPTTTQDGGSPANGAGGDLKPAFALVFDDANLLDGGFFGFNALFETGLVPAVGNLELRIGEDVFTTLAFTPVAVPEPGMGIFAGLGLAAFALRRRMNRA